MPDALDATKQYNVLKQTLRALGRSFGNVAATAHTFAPSEVMTRNEIFEQFLPPICASQAPSLAHAQG